MRLTGKNNKLSATLKSYIKTRWNTVVEMFESFLNVYTEIRPLIIKVDILSRHDRVNVTLLTEITGFLKLFKNVSVELESDKQVTSVKILPAYEMIMDHIVICQNDSATIKNMKKRANDYINNNKEQVFPKGYEMWAFFHPNFKRLQGFKTIDKSIVMQQIEFDIGLMPQLGSTNETNVSSVLVSTSTSSSSASKSKNSVFNALQDDVEMVNRSLSAEIDRYLNMKHAAVDNLLDWWNQHKEIYPQLYRYFLQFAAVPATSASAERIFSDAGNIITNKRSRLSPKNVNQLAFMHRNHRNSH